MNWLWFHAFRGNDPTFVLDVFKNGLKIPEEQLKATKANENELMIEPSSYFYLGTGYNEFGINGLTIPLTGVRGSVSPFDTGGLVKHCKPVCTWENGDKRTFLEAYTWPSDQLASLLAEYPGANSSEYLRQKRPIPRGPHEVWENVGPSADIWTDNDDYRSWLWEIRIPGGHRLGRTIFKWTSSASIHSHLIEAMRSSKGDDRDWFRFMLATYTSGGFSALTDSLIDYQEGA